MHLEYQITQPEHAFSLSQITNSYHQLLGAWESDIVTHSGPRIRATKHNGSNGYHHLCDLKKIRTHPEFERLPTNSHAKSMEGQTRIFPMKRL